MSAANLALWCTFDVVCRTGEVLLIFKNSRRYKLVQRILVHSRIDVALEVYTKAIEEDYQHAVFEPKSVMKGVTGEKKRGADS